MKKKYYYFIGLFLLIFISLELVYKWSSYPDYDSYFEEIEERHDYYNSSQPDKYLLDCAIENQKNIKFPGENPVFTYLHFEDFWKPKKLLSKAKTAEFLMILNDTSSYDWGELGTPIFDRFVTFHDKNGKCIGLSKISFDGQTYSTPSICKMKWGLLKQEENNRIIELLK